MNLATFKSVLFCPSTYFTVRDVKNPFMQNSAPVDAKLACEQWQAVMQAFQQAGYRVESIPAVAGLEDMTFAANQTFVGVHPRQGAFVVPSNMRYASRREEVPHYVGWFRERGYRVLDLALGEDFLEGGGDLLWNADLTKVWAGFGIRSTRGGVEKFRQTMAELNITVIPLELVDPTFYHLDTCFAPLTAEAVLLFPGAFSADALATIRKNIARVYKVNRDEALRFTCNGVAANGYFIAGHCSPALEAILRRENLQPVEVNTSEFEKSGGSVCCLKMFIV